MRETIIEINNLNLAEACHTKKQNICLGFDSNLLKRNGKKQGQQEQLPPLNYQVNFEVFEICRTPYQILANSRDLKISSPNIFSILEKPGYSNLYR